MVFLSPWRQIQEQHFVMTVWWHTETQWRGIENKTGEWSV